MGAPASTSAFTLSGNRAATIARNPAALAQPNEIDAAAIVDGDNHLGEIIVDLEILHVFGRRFPIGQGDMANAIGSVSTRLCPFR